MSQITSLREHIIHLLDSSADERSLVHCIRLLEGGDANRLFSLESQPATESEGLSLEEDHRGSEEADHIDVPEILPSAAKEGRRIAVSAAPIAVSKLKEFTPREIPKTPAEEEVVRAGVSSCHLFANMEAEERMVIVKALEKEEFDAGFEVLRQGGAPRNKFFMITEGTCEVIKNGKHVATLSAPMTFGELEMMYEQAECAATIRCVTKCVMYSLDQLSYQHIVLNVSIQKREKYQRLLERVSFLEALSDYDRMTIAEALVTTDYQLDEKIISFGEKGQWMHIIVEGEVQVVGRNRGKKVDVVRLGEGNVVGELEFLFDHLTVADVVAATPRVVTAKISKKHFEMVMGPISEDLKRFVARKGTYSYYLSEADDKVKAEINKLDKQTKRIATKQQSDTLENVEKDGEILLTDLVTQEPSASTNRGGKKDVVYRFPLKPLQNENVIMIGLREDGMIVSWNDAMSRATNYLAAEVCGQSFYSFLHNVKDQETMHNAINVARSFTGNLEGFYASQGKKEDVFVFARSDGLTKATLQLTVFPSVIAQGRDTADILLAIGHEVKRPPPAKQSDHTHWLTEQVRLTISEVGVDSEEKLSRIGGLITQFEGLVKGSNVSTDELRVVNVRQLIGQVVMDYGAICVEKRLAVKQNFDEMYCDEVYCDALLLPECLRYAMSNCSKHIGSDCTIRIKVRVEEAFGTEQLQISFCDDGPGYPSKVIDEFNGVTTTGHFAQLLRVKAAVEKQGGTMSIASLPGDTQVIFRIPFIPQEDDGHGESELPQDLGGSLASHSNASVVLQKKQNYTTLVVEDTPAHRNMLCAFLWERKHAVLPAYSLQDINRLSDVTDILIIDPQQSVLSDPTVISDPFAMLRERARKIAVIITAPSFDEPTKKAYQAAGFLTLQKPCTAIQAVQVLRKAEEKISKIKLEAEKIAQTRDTLAKNSRGAWKKGVLLGKGAFGEVYEAIDVLTGGKMAVKMLRVTANMNKDELLNEIEVMCTLQHPNIIHYFYCEDNVEAHTINVFMEFAAGGTLQGLLNKKGTLEFKEFQALLRDIVEGIAYIHSNRYVHCDIKTANVLLNHEGKGKIGDFGTAKQLKEGAELFVMQGSPLYMSPECMSAGEDREDGSGKIGYSFPSDIWSLGCVVMEMATNKPPFSHIEINGPMGLMSFVTGLTDIPDLSPLFDLHPSVIEFASACLHPDPAKRPTAQALLGFSIFSETTDDDMKSALKALKRAQLLHVLNAFVAFQDEEEVEQQKKDQARFKTARRDSAFFESDDDEEPQKADGGESDFFASSDDEDAPDSNPKSSKGGDGTATQPQQAQQQQQEQRPLDTPAKPHAGSARTLFAVDQAETVGHAIAPHPPSSKPSSSGTTPVIPTVDTFVGLTTEPTLPMVERTADVGGRGSTPLTLAVEELQPPLPRDVTGTSDEPSDAARHSTHHVKFAVPRPPSSDPAFVTLSPHHHKTTSQFDSTHRHQVLILHDALLALVDELKKLNSNVEATDAILDQYVKHTAAVANRDLPDEVPHSFVPNVEMILREDTDVIRSLIATLGGVADV